MVAAWANGYPCGPHGSLKKRDGTWVVDDRRSDLAVVYPVIWRECWIIQFRRHDKNTVTSRRYVLKEPILNAGYINVCSAASQNWIYWLESSQFSIYGELNQGIFALEVRNQFNFQPNVSGEITVPTVLMGVTFEFIRSISEGSIEPGSVLESLQLFNIRLDHTEIPFPAGLQLGLHHFGIKKFNYSIIFMDQMHFQCQAEGVLAHIGPSRHELDQAKFSFDIKIPFDGIWLESEYPEDKYLLNKFYVDHFSSLNLDTDFDEFSDCVVLRAYR